MQGPPSCTGDGSDDFCNAILLQFFDSTDEQHHQLCSIVGSISQELKEQNLPRTALAYFGALCSSLDRLSAEPEPPAHLVDAFLVLLSKLLSRISDAVLRKKMDYLLDLVVSFIRSKSASDTVAASGLDCLSRLLIVREHANWEDLSQHFGFFLGFATDDRPKVRRQSHVCLFKVMQRFREPSLVAAASEAITSNFERFLLLAGGSNKSSSGGPKGAQDVLHMVDAIKNCLPLMSMKFSTTILKYYRSLLELHQTPVTRRIADAVYLLCAPLTGAVSFEVHVSSEALLDLLCSLAISVSANETPGDSVAFTVRVVDAGMKETFFLNRQSCVTKLPVIFSAFGDILASEHEEPLSVVTEAFKNLIQTCLDESLLKQGMDQILANGNLNERTSVPTIIGKVCAIVESLIDYRYTAVWDLSFQIVATMFDKLGEYSTYFLKSTLRSLGDMLKLPDEDFPFKKQLHNCIGSAVVAMGPETFLSIIPLKLDAEGLSEANVSLFPILKQYTIGAQLSFFNDSLLEIIRLVRKKSAMLEHSGRIHSARTVDGLVYSLWSLLPSFCNYPLDTADSFKDLERALCTSLSEEPNVRGVICSSLQILIQQNKKALEGNDDFSETEINICRKRALSRYTPQVATNNLNVLKSSSAEILSVLCGIFLKSSKDEGGSMQITIREFASVADKGVVTRFFKSAMQKLLKVTREAVKAQNSKSSSSMEIDKISSERPLSLERARLFDLAVSLLPGLDAREIDLLFVAIKPALKEAEGLIQKKAYKVLSVMLRASDEFLSKKLEDLISLMFEVMPSCHFSAKRHRLDCLYFIVVQVSKDESEQKRNERIASFLTEIILALKEANKKTRNRAYDILVQIAHSCRNEDQGGKKEKLKLFFNMVAGGLAGETPHMISAAVKGLARLAYEFTDLVSAVYNVLPSTFLLLQRKNKEIVKANLGLLKVLVAKSPVEVLQTHLRSMVEGLMNWQDSTKNHFKAKVKLLLEMLVKKCGLDAVKEVMPEEHMKLLTNIRKIKERKERKLVTHSKGTKSEISKASPSRFSRWNDTNIFSVFDEEESENGNAETVNGRHNKSYSQLSSKASSLRTKKARRVEKRLREDQLDQFDDEPLDLLDRQRTTSALRSSSRIKRKPETDDEPEIDSQGRIVIREDEKYPNSKINRDHSEERREGGSLLSVNSHKVPKRRKTSELGWAYTGSEYSSKKAGGDVRKKDKLEPYAYWPLDRKMLSRRSEHRAVARKSMASVVKLTKRLEGKTGQNALSVKGLKFKKGKKHGISKKNR